MFETVQSFYRGTIRNRSRGFLVRESLIDHPFNLLKYLASGVEFTTRGVAIDMRYVRYDF